MFARPVRSGIALLLLWLTLLRIGGLALKPFKQQFRQDGLPIWFFVLLAAIHLVGIAGLSLLLLGWIKSRSSVNLKTVHYRGGIAKFRIPSSWVEETEPDGGGTFYDPRPNSGTLRIHVMDFEKPGAQSHREMTAKDVLSGLKDPGQVRKLPGGNAIASSVATSVEGGENLAIYSWRVGIPVSPTHFRFVVFTYTILAQQQRAPAVRREVELLGKLIAEGEYPTIRGKRGDLAPTL